jgi:hypothetical protein
MPYIKAEERKVYDDVLEELADTLKAVMVESLDGHLNYIITVLLKRLYTPRYFNYNRAMGVLECAKQEFYRRVVAEYENDKIRENGDVG